MNNIDWEILIALYHKKSINKTANEFFITQSALTKKLKNIENEWGINIVQRTSKGVIFTEDGEYLVKQAQKIVDTIKDTKNNFLLKGKVKELIKIGVPNSFSRLHLPKLMKEYINEYDRLQFKIIPNSSDVIIKQLVDKDIDIGIICGDYPFVGEKFRILQEKLYVVMPENMELKDLEHMPIIESYLNPMVKETVCQWWKNKFGTIFYNKHKVPYAEIAIEMVENGLGACFLFGYGWKYNNKKVKMIPICNEDGSIISRNVWMIISDRCFESQDMSDFITFTEKYYEAN